MYIKKVVIQGFKSYREETSTDPFSPKVNVVVGANGSGKSNFFHGNIFKRTVMLNYYPFLCLLTLTRCFLPNLAMINALAIRFVLSDMFQNLRCEDRRGALLHEGAGHSVISAFVEILFDNSDNRIPVDREEVRLRRTVSSKKDEYYLDGKHVSKTEVMNLLESAGFSRSNPYYIVQQGKIASLTLMKDSERLDLLKEIGAHKRKQIGQTVHYLEERLRELDEEKEELEKYQELDKERRSLEYNLLDHELNDTKNELVSMDDDRIFFSEMLSNADDEVADVREKVKSFDKEIEVCTEGIDEIKSQKEDAEKKRTKALKLVTQIELDLRDIEDRISNEKRAKDEAAKDLHSMRKESERSKSELAEISNAHQAKLQEEEEMSKSITDREKQLGVLYQKQGRATQFKNEAARDKWLRKEIHDLERVLSSNRKQESLLQEEIQKLKDEINNLMNYIESRRSESGKLESALANRQKDYNDFVQQKDALQDERKSLWKQENSVTAEIDRLKEDLVKACKSLDYATPRDTRRGLNYVDKIVREHKKRGVFGPVLELIDCEEKFFTAVEVAAGNSLLHVVVENDDISTEIIKIWTKRKDEPSRENEEKDGRVTFIPLNRVYAPSVNIPQSSDFVPLLKKLKYRADHRPAFELIFGRTVICRDLETATRVARSNDLDCITLDDRKIMDLVTKHQQVDAERDHAKSELEQFKDDITRAMKQKGLLEKALGKKEKSLDNIRNQIEQIQSGIATKNNEMGTELIDQLTSEERDLLSRLNPEIAALKEKFLLCKNNRIEVVQANLGQTVQDAANDLEQLMNRRRMHLAKQAECMKKMRDLGSLPADAFEKYNGKDRLLLQKLLHDRNEQLKQFSHVNQKALDQYVNFNEQRDQLRRRRDELALGDKKIRDLISLLDQKKDESIERTFKGVGRHFREVFSELVQCGHGALVMMKKKDGDAEDDDNDEDGPREADPKGRIDKYVGVKVKACVLCRDVVRRLADMADTQFIATTFRPEILKVADKIYGVAHKSRVSYIDVVSKEQALDFIEQDQAQNAS
uniref:Structural maintenance of chromosomes protein 3 n=1 Tax=Aegilops tauschii TaxID=37682 RepID=R7WDJ5_AEGTA